VFDGSEARTLLGSASRRESRMAGQIDFNRGKFKELVLYLSQVAGARRTRALAW